MKKTILICLDGLGIGGVETFVYNQTISLIRKGYSVVILSKKGIYTEKLQEKGAICIEFDFETKNYYDYDKIKKIVEIIKKYNIKEAHINQIPEINTVMPACIIANIPYIAYVHMGVSLIDNEELNVYNYFERQYFTFKNIFKSFFELAYKIVAITPEIGKYIQNRYEIEDSNKITVLRNSICFEEYEAIREIKDVKDILIIGRITEEQKESFIRGIKLYNIISSSKEDIKLTIVGDGNKKQEIEQYVKDNSIKNVTFVGATNNIKDYIENSDAVIGVGRCILEAISMKRIAIISGYYEMKDIVSENNIDMEINENFGGKSLIGNDVEDIATKILNLSADNIKEITELNYKKINEKLDISKNIYIADIDKLEYNYEKVLDNMLEINQILGKEEEKKSELVEKNWKEHVEYKNWIEQKEENLLKQIETLNQEKQKLENEGIFDKIKRKRNK